MKKSIALSTAVLGAALLCAAVWAAEQNRTPETAVVLPPSAYRVPLEEIIVQGKEPYWRQKAPPRWDKPKIEAPKPGQETSRLQWAPRYTRDERDDYNSVREPLANPPPRTKIFELRF